MYVLKYVRCTQTNTMQMEMTEAREMIFRMPTCIAARIYDHLFDITILSAYVV